MLELKEDVFWLKMMKWSLAQEKLNEREGFDKFPTFRKAIMYSMNLLCIPMSTAAVERVFSQVTWAKNKYRNR